MLTRPLFVCCALAMASAATAQDIPVSVGYLDAVRDGLLTPDSKTIDSIHQQAVHLTEIVEDLRVLALAEVGELRLHRGSEAVPELLLAVAQAEDPALRAALIRGLATSADARAFDVLLDAVEEGEGGEARLQAINGLGLIGDPRALPVLRDLEAAGDERKRRFSRTAIQRITRAGT